MVETLELHVDGLKLKLCTPTCPSPPHAHRLAIDTLRRRCVTNRQVEKERRSASARARQRERERQTDTEALTHSKSQQ